MKKLKIGKLEIITTLIVIINIFIYEFGFCNLESIKNGNYNFSLFRIIAYIIFLLIYLLGIKGFAEEARKTISAKKKIIIGYILISVLYMIYKITNEENNYKLILTLLAELNGLLFILYVTKDYIKNVILTIVTLGFVISLSTNVYHVIDEKKHFMAAFNCAVGHFDLEHGVSNEEFDNINLNMSSSDFAKGYFGRYSSFVVSENGENKSIFSTPATYNPILYMPSSIGINLARILGGSIADIFFAGRIFNLIFYGLLLVMMFEVLPFKKNLFYAIFLLPMILALSGSYSIDGATIGFIGIFIAYILKIYEENKEIDLKKFFIIVGLYLLTLLGKSGAYLPIGLIVFMLPILKTIKTEKKIRYTAIALIVVTIIIGGIQAFNMASPVEGDVRGGDTSPSRQIEFLKENPTSLIRIYTNFVGNTILNTSWYKEFNSNWIFTNAAYYVTFLVFIYVFYIALTDGTAELKKKDKILMIISFVFTFFITSFIMYLSFTPVGSLRIAGFQGRYLLPVLPLILMCMNSKKMDKGNANNEEIYNKKSLILGCITFLDILTMLV